MTRTHHAGVVRTNRRRLVMGAAAAVALPRALETRGQAAVEFMAPVLSEVTRGAPIIQGKLRLEVPALADNGNLVPLKVTVDSPMTGDDYVRSIVLVAERNPRPIIARFSFGPLAGRAGVATRIRLVGSQRVVAIAEMSDGTFWSDASEVTVTLAACIEDT